MPKQTNKGARLFRFELIGHVQIKNHEHASVQGVLLDARDA